MENEALYSGLFLLTPLDAPPHRPLGDLLAFGGPMECGVKVPGRMLLGLPSAVTL